MISWWFLNEIWFASAEWYLLRGYRRLLSRYLRWVWISLFGGDVFDVGYRLLMTIVLISIFVVVLLRRSRYNWPFISFILVDWKNVMMEGCFLLDFDGLDGSIVLLLFFVVSWSGSKLVSCCCLSLRIFLRADIITFFAIAIHCSNEFVFNYVNFVMSLANHFNGSCGRPITWWWRVLTSWIKSW